MYISRSIGQKQRPHIFYNKNSKTIHKVDILLEVQNWCIWGVIQILLIVFYKDKKIEQIFERPTIFVRIFEKRLIMFSFSFISWKCIMLFIVWLFSRWVWALCNFNLKVFKDFDRLLIWHNQQFCYIFSFTITRRHKTNLKYEII